jgi:large subunit ribosomal protein L7A
MAIPELEDGAVLRVGAKQTRLALEQGMAIKVFFAQDAEARLVNPIVLQCRNQGVPVVGVASMQELGKACGIQVGAATAVLIRK